MKAAEWIRLQEQTPMITPEAWGVAQRRASVVLDKRGFMSTHTLGDALAFAYLIGVRDTVDALVQKGRL